MSTVTTTPNNATGRREFLGILAAAGLLSSCGDGADGGDGRDAGASGKTRTFVDVTGRGIEVPDVARRIVATNDQNAGAQLLSLGAPLVGIASRDGVLDPTISAYFDVEELETVGEHFEPNIEKIASLRPDLIVHEGYDGKVSMDAAVQKQLEQIAPVVGIDAFRSIEEVLADHAELLGTAARAVLDQQEAEFRDELARLRDLLGDRWGEVTISLIVSNGDALEAWAPSLLGETDILTRVGATAVPLMERAALPENGGFLANLSLEQIPEFSADLVLVDTAFEGAAVLDHPLFTKLPAAVAGQVVEIDSSMSAAHFPGYIAFTKAMVDRIDGQTLRTDLV